MSGPDLTDPKNNPLIPTGQAEPIAGDLTDPAQNELIDPSAYQHLPARTDAPSDRPSVESVEKILAKFIEGASAADLERLKAALGIRR